MSTNTGKATMANDQFNDFVPYLWWKWHRCSWKRAPLTENKLISRCLTSSIFKKSQTNKKTNVSEMSLKCERNQRKWRTLWSLLTKHGACIRTQMYRNRIFAWSDLLRFKIHRWKRWTCSRLKKNNTHSHLNTDADEKTETHLCTKEQPTHVAFETQDFTFWTHAHRISYVANENYSDWNVCRTPASSKHVDKPSFEFSIASHEILMQ